MKHVFNIALVIAGFVLVVSTASAKEPSPKEQTPARLYELMQRLVKEQSVAGAQVVVGKANLPLVARSFGVRSVQDRRPVDNDTQFCIGSCSKMFAGAVIVSLSTEKTVDLNVPIDRWLKNFKNPKLADGGKAVRAPNLRELLCHRGGIYSQRNRLTENQTRWIRDFNLSLADSVTGIAKEQLSSNPGESYAYSGAGYCVLGRVAEVASGRAFNELLAEHVTKPLKLSRTTYFPDPDEENVAVGHAVVRGKLAVVDKTPHLLRRGHKLALIGGSVYAPAREAAEFARMLLNKGKVKDGEVLTSDEWKKMTSISSPRTGGGYGFGLSIAVDAPTGDVVAVSHGGALFGSFSMISVDFRTRRFGVVTYTGKRSRAVAAALQQWVKQAGN